MRTILAFGVGAIIFFGILGVFIFGAKQFGVPFSLGVISATILFQFAYKSEHGKWFGD